MPRPNLFSNCHCPHCKARLDAVASTATICPHCNQPLDPKAVWRTFYDPESKPPWWNRIFPWSVVLILFGLTVYVLKRGAGWNIPRRGWLMGAADLSFAVGVVQALRLLAIKIIKFVFSMKEDE